MGDEVVHGFLDRHERGVIAERAQPSLVTAEGGLMHNSPRVRRVMMPSRCIGAHSGVGGTSWRRVDCPKPP